MENIQKFRKKGKKLGEYMMTKLRLLRDQKKYRSRGVTLKYMLDRVDSRDLIIVFSSCTRKGIRARYNYVRTLKEVPCNKLFLLDDFASDHRGSFYLGSNMKFEEAVMRKTPFAYLETIRGLYTGGMIRSGSYRIMGPANHSLAYGLILISGLPLLCIDEEKHCFTLFRHLPLLLLVVVLTGSRSTLAVMGLELLLLTVLAPGEQRKKLLFTIVPAGLLILLLAFLFPNSPPGHYILLQLSTVVDEMFGTSYAIRYGVDSTSLANSASYRDALLDIFTVDWLNPWLGQGSGYHFSWYIPGGATIHSIDNFYVANYIRYGYPGLVVYGLLILQAVGEMVRCGIQKKDRTMLCLALAVCGYFLNLCWMDTLQTIKYAYLPIALFQVISREKWENMSDLQHKAVHRYIR